MAKQTWDERLANFLERTMAAAVVGADPKPLQEEYARLLAEAPPGRLKALKLTKKETDGKPAKPTKPAKG